MHVLRRPLRRLPCPPCFSSSLWQQDPRKAENFDKSFTKAQVKLTIVDEAVLRNLAVGDIDPFVEFDFVNSNFAPQVSNLMATVQETLRNSNYNLEAAARGADAASVGGDSPQKSPARSPARSPVLDTSANHEPSEQPSSLETTAMWGEGAQLTAHVSRLDGA